MSRHGNRLIAFIVDDEGLIATTIELILLSRGFLARSFVDPVDALQAAQSAVPNLLIADVIMPKMNGIELAIQMTQLHPACKILLFSGQAATEDLQSDAKSKGYEFHLLAKPVHPNVLLETIEELLVN